MLTQQTPETMNSQAAEAVATVSIEEIRQQRLMQAMKEDQQQKYLHLQAQAEMLLRQLTEMKQQREQIDDRQLVGSTVG